MESAGAMAQAGRGPALAKYDVLEEIGHGGMATVYRAKDPRLGREVAIKIIHPHLRDSSEVRHRFAAEARAVAMLRHPNIVEVYDVSAEGEGEPFLVVELVRGMTLRRLLRDRGVLPPEVAAALGLCLLSALGHAHAAGVVHRDVKPENVMIEATVPGAEVASVKLMDFGIAKLLDAQGVTSTGQVLGSPAHMAPEQIEGESVDARADLFGLGVLLYEAMVGHLPFEGNNPAQVLRRVLDGTYPRADTERGTVGRSFGAVLDRALAVKPDDRFASADAMADAFRGELARVGITEPARELAAWISDGAAYEAEHRPRVTAALYAEGRAARRRGDVLRAASDFNRALAYSPDDPALLRAVSGLQSAERRARVLRRAVRALGIVAVLGLLAFGVTSAVRPRLEPVANGEPKTAPPPIARATTPEPPREPPVVTAVASAPAIVPPPPRSPPFMPAPPRETFRAVRLGALRPANGMRVQVDDGPPRDAVPGARLDVEATRSHQLQFTCVQDICDPQIRLVGPGSDEETLAVTLTIRPAQVIVVEGEAGSSYQVAEQPSLVFREGSPVSVPMRGGTWRVTVVELPSKRSRVARLVAGKVERVSFAEAPP